MSVTTIDNIENGELLRADDSVLFDRELEFRIDDMTDTVFSGQIEDMACKGCGGCASKV